MDEKNFKRIYLDKSNEIIGSEIELEIVNKRAILLKLKK